MNKYIFEAFQQKHTQKVTWTYTICIPTSHAIIPFSHVQPKEIDLRYILLPKAKLSNTVNIVHTWPPVIINRLCLFYVVFVMCACCNWFCTMCMIIPFPVLMSYIYFLICSFRLWPLTWTFISDLWRQQLTCRGCNSTFGKRCSKL